jgi:hypothetical protein
MNDEVSQEEAATAKVVLVAGTEVVAGDQKAVLVYDTVVEVEVSEDVESEDSTEEEAAPESAEESPENAEGEAPAEEGEKPAEEAPAQ